MFWRRYSITGMAALAVAIALLTARTGWAAGGSHGGGGHGGFSHGGFGHVIGHDDFRDDGFRHGDFRHDGFHNGGFDRRFFGFGFGHDPFRRREFGFDPLLRRRFGFDPFFGTGFPSVALSPFLFGFLLYRPEMPGNQFPCRVEARGGECRA